MSDNFTDIFSRHAHFVERYKSGLVNKLDPFLRRITRNLRLELLKTNTVISRNRILQKLSFVEDLVKSELTTYIEFIESQSQDFAMSEAEFASKALLLQSDLFNSVIPSQNQLNSAVRARPFNNRLLKDSLKLFTQEQAKQIRNLVSMGFAEGLTTQDIVRQIVGTKSANYSDGILSTTRASASRLVRTAMAHTSSVARDLTFKENEDLIPYYEWVSTLDSKTSNTCKALDGQVFKTGKGKLPPIHLNCRSTTSPLFIDEVSKTKAGKLTKNNNLGGTRASVDGQVNADLNYNDWLKNQSQDFQNEALGINRAKLFREGLSVDRFTNRDDAPLTLEQIKKLNPIAWDKSGI
jgi:SPP1 gp7 family putative phage head morphogenesis protein